MFKILSFTSFQDVGLLSQFICPHTGIILKTIKTGNTYFTERATPLPLIDASGKTFVQTINAVTKLDINRGYYTVVRRYEFYVRVARTISHE